MKVSNMRWFIKCLDLQTGWINYSSKSVSKKAEPRVSLYANREESTKDDAEVLGKIIYP